MKIKNLALFDGNVKTCRPRLLMLLYWCTELLLYNAFPFFSFELSEQTRIPGQSLMSKVQLEYTGG